MMLAMSTACVGLALHSPLRQGSSAFRAPAVAMVFGGGIDAGGGAEDGWVVPELPMSFVGEDYVDPLATNRPKYDLCAASGRPDEVCCGAIAPATPFDIDDWTAHMRGEGGQPRRAHRNCHAARRHGTSTLASHPHAASTPVL